MSPLNATTYLALLLAGCAITVSSPSVAAAPLSETTDLIDIRTVVPDIAEDIRYAGNDNFTGAVVDGYRAPKCLLRTAAARALGAVEMDLRRQGYRLKLWDCYRPARAVSAFVRWAGEPEDGLTKAAHYPALDKRQLLGEYIAPVSGHSRGATMDLTLMRCDVDQCTTLDMGTPFDFFDPLAHTDAPGLTPAQRDNRQRLVRAMRAHGFVNYAAEWWHYTLPSAASPTVMDVPVE